LWADGETLAEIQHRFDYSLAPPPEPGRFYNRPSNLTRLPARSTTLGLHIDPMAYSTDMVKLDDAAFAALTEVELWIGLTDPRTVIVSIIYIMRYSVADRR
jgi:phosphoribosyl 1,2-cyclic phosphate phosphodiesterase